MRMPSELVKRMIEAELAKAPKDQEDAPAHSWVPVHKKLALFFATAQETRRREEYPFHLSEAGQFTELKEYIKKSEFNDKLSFRDRMTVLDNARCKDRKPMLAKVGGHLGISCVDESTAGRL